MEEFYARLSTVRTAAFAELARKRIEIEQRGLLYHVLREAWARAPSGVLGTVVDVGAGNATNLQLLIEGISVNRAIAIDLTPPSGGTPGGIEFLRGSATSLGELLEPKSVDLALMIEVIEHLWDPDRAMEEVRSILRPGGFLILTTPNLASLPNRVALLGGFQPIDTEVSTRRVFGRPGKSPVVGHIRNFTFRSIIAFATHYGYRVERAYTVPNLGWESGVQGIGLVKFLDRLGSGISAGLGSRCILVLSSSESRA